MVPHGATSVAGSFIQTLTMVDIATGWTECLPLVTRDGSLVVEAMTRVQCLFPWVIRGADFDNDSAFMNDPVVPWSRAQKIEVTRFRAYKKNDQAFVEQKNGAAARRLRAARWGRDGMRDGASLRGSAPIHELLPAVVQAQGEASRGRNYHPPATPYERALAHPKLAPAIKRGLRGIPHSRSRATACRDPCGAGRAR
jgi:hypothetical protein